MKSNSLQGQSQSQGYINKKDESYPQPPREPTPAKSSEAPNTSSNKKSSPNYSMPRNPQQIADSRPSIDQSSLTNGISDVSQAKNMPETVPGQPHQQPQPIINSFTILALDYLQTYLLGQKHAIPTDPTPVPNSFAKSLPPENEFKENSPKKEERDNYYNNSSQKSNRNDFHDDRHGKRDHNYRGDHKNYDDQRRNQYTNDKRGYDRSRSRSNEKRDSYDRRHDTRNYQKDKTDDRYKNRSNYKDYKNYNKEHQDREQYSSQKGKAYEDWNCMSCGNWCKGDSCIKCGTTKADNLIIPLGENSTKPFPPQERKNNGKGYWNEGNLKYQYYRNGGRNDYRNKEYRNQMNNYPSYGNPDFRP